MENYTKGKNVEEPLEKGKIPIPNLPEHFLWMRVNPGTKVRNVLTFALKAFKDEKYVVWSGSGPALEKTITCVEIMKRRFKALHQITKICFRKVEEFWEPKVEDLDQLVVVREIPTIHILLSKEALDKNEPGYQAPGAVNATWEESEKPWPRGSQVEQKLQKGPKRKRVEPKQNKPKPSIPSSTVTSSATSK